MEKLWSPEIAERVAQRGSSDCRSFTSLVMTRDVCFLCCEPPKWLHEYFNLCASFVHMDIVVVPDCSVEQNQGEDAAEPEQPGGGGPGH